MIPQYVPIAPALVREPFHRSGWVYEEKVDGWRIIAYKDGEHLADWIKNDDNVDQPVRDAAWAFRHTHDVGLRSHEWSSSTTIGFTASTTTFRARHGRALDMVNTSVNAEHDVGTGLNPCAADRAVRKIAHLAPP